MDAIQLLVELIALPSVNPAFLPAGDARAGEQAVANHLGTVAGRAGLEIEWQEVLPGRRNLLVRLCPKSRVRQRVLLAPHMDTVGGAAAAFDPRRAGGRIHGRGACDTKGSVAAMLAALVGVARGGRRPESTAILFAGLVDEENGQAGSRALVKARFRADLAVVGEPTELRVVTAHKGDVWLALETRGRAAHGACPERGRNAVHAMARVVVALETQYADQLCKRRHPLLGNPTINVGAIAGGTQANVVPDRCRIEIDRRTLPGETLGGVVSEIRKFLRQQGLTVQFQDTKGALCPPLETDASLPLVRQFLEATGRSEPAAVHYFCDAAILSDGGIPSVVFGPGNIAQAHTADEWVSVREVERATAQIETFLRSLA
jgi:acetylornithine deacetylase/succinyl-diaminopimelate desuccinylase-like protein